MVSLESSFTRDNATTQEAPKEEQYPRKVQENKKVNIWTIEHPKFINLGVTCWKEEMLQYTDLFKEFYDVFTWTYDDFKEYDKENFQHMILLKEGVVIVRKNPRMMNPKMKPLAKSELEKMEKDGIIFSIRHS